MENQKITKEQANNLLRAIFVPKEIRRKEDRALAFAKIVNLVRQDNLDEAYDAYCEAINTDNEYQFDNEFENLTGFTAYINEEKKTVVLKFPNGDTARAKCDEQDTFNPNVGVALAFMKYATGSTNTGLRKMIEEQSVIQTKKDLEDDFGVADLKLKNIKVNDKAESKVTVLKEKKPKSEQKTEKVE